ncbi:MAG: hypothetical protein HQL11_04830 [Candidatus Omnitrophica bacterium]|nr:hypothetical protein [Candidatus Omnitrophota bacterium]
MVLFVRSREVRSFQRRLSRLLALVFVVTVVLAFFLPWVKIEVNVAQYLRSPQSRTEDARKFFLITDLSRALTQTAAALTGMKATVHLTGNEAASLGEFRRESWRRDVVDFVRFGAEDSRNACYVYLFPLAALLLGLLAFWGADKSGFPLKTAGCFCLVIGMGMAFASENLAGRMDFAQVTAEFGYKLTALSFFVMGLFGFFTGRFFK